MDGLTLVMSITIQAKKINNATLRLFSLAEQCHTQNCYLRCFNSEFDANLVYSLSRLRRQPQNEDYLKIVLHQKSSFIKYCLPLMAISYERLSSIKGCLPSNFVFHQRLSSIKSRLPSKFVFQ